MTRLLPMALASLWLPIVIIFGATPAAFPSAPTVFVDFDGDGFDDNAPDDDADGIPDECERHGFVSATITQLGVSQMFTERGSAEDTPSHLRCGEKFGRRKFATRAICEDRLDFDSGFGSNLGLGGGLGSGGGCAGGVCF